MGYRMSQEPRISHGHCFDCLKKKTSVDYEFPVKFTITLPKLKLTYKCEACCMEEYDGVKKSLPPFVLVELDE